MNDENELAPPAFSIPKDERRYIRTGRPGITMWTRKKPIEFETGQRVKHRTGQTGVIVGQPDSDPIVRFDGETHDRVCYRSEIQPEENP
jgi:hypothetical protein